MRIAPYAVAIAIAAVILGARPAPAEEARPVNRRVEVAQRLLQLLDYDPGPADNEPKSQTSLAIIAFERDQRRDLVGEVDDDLIKALRIEAWRRKIVQNKLNGRRAIGQAEVREAQGILARLHLEPGPVDGYYGGQTMAAIMAFQQSRNLPVDGLLDGALLNTLRQVDWASESTPRDRLVLFYNWADYIHPSFRVEAQRATGITVKMEVFQKIDDLEEELRRGAADHDIVVPTSSMMVQRARLGVFRKIELSKLENIGNLAPDILKKIPADLKETDPATGKLTSLYGIPYMLGTTGFGIDIEAVTKRLPNAPLNSTAILFDPALVSKLKVCGVRVINDADDVASMALIHIAERENRPVQDLLERPSPADIEKVAALLKGIADYVQAGEATSIRRELEEGRACLTLGYSGDILQARQSAKHRIVYRTPRKGSVLWIDMLAIPAYAGNADGAMRILDYLLQPKVIAAASNHTRYANANGKALEKEYGMEPELVRDLSRSTPLSAAYAVGEREPKIAEAIRNAWDASIGTAR